MSLKRGRCCVAFGCSMKKGTNLLSEVKLFNFPRDPKRREQWEIAVHRENWKANNSSQICNLHFISGRPSKDPLHPDYVPSIFCFKRRNPSSIDRYERHAKRAKTDASYSEAEKCLRPTLKSCALPSLFLPKTPTYSEGKISGKEKKEKTLKEENSAKRLAHYSEINRFPLNDPERLQKWLKALKRESWQPTKHSFLCSQHFTPDSYKSSLKHFLKDDAVPTIACFSTDRPKIVRKRTIDYSLPDPHKKPIVVLQRNAVLEQYSDLNYSPKLSLGNCQSDTLQISKETDNNKNSSFEANELEIYKDAVCDGNFLVSGDDFSDIEFSDSEDTKQRLDIMTAHYKKAKKKLKMCQQRCGLYKKEITALKEVIDSLRQINSVSDDN